MASKKAKRPTGYSYYKATGRLKKTVVVHLADETYNKLKWQAYLDERSIQKTTRRIIETAVKDVELPPKE
jgi:hypothetical protein